MKKTFNGTVVICDPAHIGDLMAEKRLDVADGDNLNTFGFSDYLWLSVGNDGRLSAVKLEGQTNKTSKEIIKLDDLAEKPSQRLGSIPIDSGVAVVVYLNEALKYDPNFAENKGVILENFKGRIETLTNENNDPFIVAKSTKDTFIFAWDFYIPFLS